MDSDGLSKHMNQTLEALRPASAAAPPQYPRDAVDLSNAQNEVLRPELLEFFKSTVEDRVTGQTFALPTTNGGDLDAREALASFFNNYFDPVHAVKAEHIVLTAGASDALENVIHAVCDHGDSILVPGPSWHGFVPLLKSRTNINIVVAQPPTYENYDNYLIPSLRAVYDFSSEKSRIKAVLVCNPQNPLSRCYDRAALLELMEFCQENGLHLIMDEMYALAELNVPCSKAPAFVSALSLTEPLVRSGAVKVDPSKVHIVWSASKLFGLSGMRIGCIISQQNAPLLNAISLLTHAHTNTIASTFLSALLTWSQLSTLLKLNNERLTTNYRILGSALKKWDIPYVTPTHGIFLFARFAKTAKSASDEQTFYDALATQKGILLAHGRNFKGAEGNYGWARVRFSIAPADLHRAIERIESFLAQQQRQQ